MTTSPAPTLLQFNGKNIHFIADVGIVDKVSKRVETRFNASASGGGVRHYGNVAVSNPTTLNVSSTNTTVTEIWMRDGDKELDHTLRTDLSVRENQKVSIVMVANEHERIRHYVGILNHNTGTWQSLNSLEHLVHQTVMKKMSAAVYFLMICGAAALGFALESWIPTVLILGGIIYLAITRGNKMSAAKTAFNNHVAEVKQWLTANN
ncbi:hypothetical protein [Spirosoma migulaei]